MHSCLFCQIVAEEIPSYRIAETERAIALMDIFPATPGHALVIPRRHSADALEAETEDLTACMTLAASVGRAAVAGLGADGVTFQTLARSAAGQTIFHVHIHVIPRQDGDQFAFPWPSVPGDVTEIEAQAERLRGAFTNDEF